MLDNEIKAIELNADFYRISLATLKKLPPNMNIYGLVLIKDIDGNSVVALKVHWKWLGRDRVGYFSSYTGEYICEA